MKKKEMNSALEALKTIKMPKIENKELRNLVIKDHLQLLGEKRKYEAGIEDLRIAFLEAYSGEQDEVVDLQGKLRVERNPAKQMELMDEIAKHKDYLEAVKEFNTKTEKMGNEEIEIEPIPMDEFVSEYQKQDYDMGVIEALYPMFKN